MYFMNFGDMSFQDYFLSGTSNKNLAIFLSRPKNFTFAPSIIINF